MASSGLHSNGFSLVRQILAEPGWRSTPSRRTRPPLGDELLTPTRIYARDCLALADACEVHAFAHITGGGLAANLARVLPPGTDACWTGPPGGRRRCSACWPGRGGIDAAEMERVFNMGVGMTAVVAPGRRPGAGLLAARASGWVLGEVTGPGTVSPGRAHPG